MRILRSAARIAAVVTTALAASLGATWGAVPVAGASDVARVPPTPTVRATVKMTIKAGDFTFSVPEKIAAGLVRVKIVNKGGEPHQAQVARLTTG